MFSSFGGGRTKGGVLGGVRGDDGGVGKMGNGTGGISAGPLSPEALGCGGWRGGGGAGPLSLEVFLWTSSFFSC